MPLILKSHSAACRLYMSILSILDLVQQLSKYDEDIVFDYIMSPDRDLENSKPTYMNGTLGHDDASSNQVWIQNIQWFSRLSSGRTFIEILNNTPIFCVRHSGSYVASNYLWLRKDQQFNRHGRYFDYNL